MTLKLLFMGTPDFAVPSLMKIIDEFPDFEISVITMPDKIRGRGKKLSPSPIKAAALANHLSVYTPASKQDVSIIVKELQPDLIVVVAYGMILEAAVVDHYFCINVHASLLPNYRGASPIQSALLNGDSKTGVTIIRLIQEMDAGNILLHSELQITPDDTHGSLSNKLAILGANACATFIQTQFLAESVLEIAQDHSSATYCSKITKEDLFVDETTPEDIIYRKIKAFSPKPAAYCIKNEKRIKLIDAKFENNKLTITELQPEGKAKMPYNQYCLGHTEGIGLYGN